MSRSEISRKTSSKDTEEKKNNVKDLVVPKIQKESNSIDRISHLPDEIRFKILSLLSATDIVATRILSKTWLYLLPGWYFDSGSVEYNLVYGIASRNEIEEEISASLKAFCCKEVWFRVVSLCVHYAHFNQSNMDTWTKLIVKGKVNVLHLRYEGPDTYYLPRSIFVATSLNGLILYGCELKTYGLSNDYKLDCLRELRLEKVYLCNSTLHNFFKICRNIEKLKLKKCTGKRREIRICGLKYLEKVEIWDSYSDKKGYGIEKIVIDSPCVHDLIFYGKSGESCNIDLAYPGQLRTLILDTYVFPKFYFVNNFRDFTGLRKLCLYGCQNMKKKIEIFNPSIDSLELYHGGQVVQVVTDTPSLQSYKFIGKDFEQFSFLLKTGLCLRKKVILEFNNRRQIDASWFLKLRKFVEKLSHDTVLALRLPGVVCFNLQELQELEVSVPQVCYLKELKLKDLSSSSLTSGEDLINGSLWSCRPENLVVSVTKQPSTFMEDVSNYLKCDESMLKKCCKSEPIKCWRHYLEGFELERFTGTSKKWPCEEKMKINIKFHWVKEETECVDKVARGLVDNLGSTNYERV